MPSVGPFKTKISHTFVNSSCAFCLATKICSVILLKYKGLSLAKITLARDYILRTVHMGPAS